MSTGLSLVLLYAMPAHATLMPAADRLERGPVASAGLAVIGGGFSADVPIAGGIGLGVGGLGRGTPISADLETFATARLTHVLWHRSDGWTLAQMWSVSRAWTKVGGRVGDERTKWTAEPAALLTVPMKLSPAFDLRIRLAFGPAFSFGYLFEPNVRLYGDPPELPPGSNVWEWGLDLSKPSWRFAGEIAMPFSDHWEFVYGGGSFASIRGLW